MLNGKKIVVVMPAYYAEKTLEMTYNAIPREIVDEVILVDDASEDRTVELAKNLGIKTFVHPKNIGYGGVQKTCYRKALERNADVIIMVHPDYQYDPALIPAMASMVAYGTFDAVLGSRIIGIGARKGGMPLYKYIANRLLTAFENIIFRYKLSEYHTGYRAFSRKVLEELPLEENADGFLFDNEMLAQLIYFNYRIGEVSCPCRYFSEASSIDFQESMQYGIGVILTGFKFLFQRIKIFKFSLFYRDGSKLKAQQ